MHRQNSNKPHSKPTAYINLNSFNYLSQPVESFEALINIKWDIMSLQISSHGNNGVLFIQTTIGSFVLKMNNQAPLNLFFNTFAQLIDVNVPEIQILACYEEFFQILTFKIQQFCIKDQQLSARLRKRMDFPFYQIMDYIPSVSYLQVGRDRFQKHLMTEWKFQSMGICIGFDMLINNSDRFKLGKIWSSLSEGNVANVLIEMPEHYMHSIEEIRNRENLNVKLGEYCFIDHEGFLLDIEGNKLAGQNFHKYMSKVTLFHQQMIQFIRGQLPLPEQFDGLIHQIQFYTKHNLTNQQLTNVIEGIIYSTNMFLSCFEDGAFDDVLVQLRRSDKEKSHRQQVTYWDEYWNRDLDKIKLKHLEVYHLKVSAIYATYHEVIQTICEKVAKNVAQNKTNKKRHSHRRTKNNRQQSKLSNKTTLKQQNPNKINLDFLNEDTQSNQQEQKPKIDDERLRQLERQQQERLAKEQLKRKRLKERLQAFQKKNYQQFQQPLGNYQKK